MTDAERFDWLEAYLEGGELAFCAHPNGGFLIHMIADSDHSSVVHKRTLRDAIDAAVEALKIEQTETK